MSNGSLRIGINALYLIPGSVGGTEIYLRRILLALAAIDQTNQYFIIRGRETGPDLVPKQTNFADLPQPVRVRFRPARIAYEQMVLPIIASRFRLDLLFNPGFTGPLATRIPMVSFFHDLQYAHHPEYFRWFDLPFWRVLLPAIARRSRRIVVPSESVRADVESFYSLPRSRIAVIPHGVEPEFAEIARRRAASPGDEKLVLTVSTLHPHKNLATLLTVFRGFLDRHPGWRLVIAGLKGFEAPQIERLRRELRLENAVTLTGWIPREELYHLFERASAFIYPSRFEGFGMPVLEALAAGLPTACSRISPLIEIAGDAGLFFDPDQPEQLGSALEALTSDNDLRRRLIQAGRARAARYTWETSARDLLRVLRSAVR